MWIRPENTLLLVEPDSFIRRCLATALQQAGYRVLQAGDGPEALQVVRQNPRLRMVISEVLLPSSPATGFLRELRRIRRDVPVLFTSAVQPKLLIQSLPQRDIMAKPFSPSALVERVGRQLAGQPINATKVCPQQPLRTHAPIY
jgi:two-component system, cell cycle sensor histidine kinase and response regulator CckA